MVKTFAALLLMASPALAQQPADPALLLKALNAVQQQRNYALDMQASAEAREAVLKEEIAKLRAQIQEQQKAPPPPKAPDAQ
jgi:hypothetical protein